MVDVYRRPGSPYWYVRGLRKSTGCTRKADALRAAVLIVEKHEEAQRQRLLKSDGLLWADAAKSFIENSGLKPTTARGYTSLAIGVLERMGNFNLAALNEADVKEFIHKRRSEDVDDATIKRHISLISAVIRWSIHRQLRGHPARNVMTDVDRSMLQEKRPVDRHLRANQFEAVIASLPSVTDRRIVMVLAGTGIRSSELIELKWSEVNLKDRLLEFGNLDASRTKTGKFRKIPLLEGVYEAVVAQYEAQTKVSDDGRARQLPDPNSHVFPNNLSGEQRYSLASLRKRIKKNTGLKTFTIHGLRHSYASWLLQRGVDPITIRDLLGHSTLYTTTRYAHVVSDDAVARVRQIGIPVVAQFSTHSLGLKTGIAQNAE